MKEATEYFSKFFMQKYWEDLESSKQGISIFFKLGYNSFTILCQFLVYSEVNQLYGYKHSLFGFHSHLGHHRALSRVPCAIQHVLKVILYVLLYTYISVTNLYMCVYIYTHTHTHTHQCIYANLPIHPILLFSPLGVHTFVLCVYVSISASKLLFIV